MLLFSSSLLGGSKSYLEIVTEFLYIFSSVSSGECCLISLHKMVGSICDLDFSLNVWFRPLTHLITNTQWSSWLKALLCWQGEAAAHCGSACCPQYSVELGAARPDSQTQADLSAWGKVPGIPPKMIFWHGHAQRMGFPVPDIRGYANLLLHWCQQYRCMGLILLRVDAMLCTQQKPVIGRGACASSAMPMLFPWPACFNLPSWH